MVSQIALFSLLAPCALVATALVARTRVEVAGALGVAVAALAGLAVAVLGPLSSAAWTVAGWGASIRLDPLSVTLLAMVAILGLVILRFSRTYLEGDPRRDVFLARLAATIASVELLVISGNLGLFWLAWVSTSLGLHGLLLFRAERPRARIAARKKFLVARVGDLCLLVAFALFGNHFGTADIGAIIELAPTLAPSSSLAVATTLLALAAVLKSAQFPTHGWLIEVMETPTPVSALLHAGLLNAGPFLVLRFAAVMQLGGVASAVLVVVGGFTALFASVVLLTQPSIKVTLGYSSAAHMGFMLLVCGLGVYPAALLHLVAHSFYKAHAFLSSASVVERARAAHVRLATRWRSPWTIAASIVVALVMVPGVGMVLGFDLLEHASVLAVASIVVMGLAQLLVPSIDSDVSWAAMRRTIVLALVVTLAFFGLEEGTRLLMGASLPAVGLPSTLALVLAGVVLAAFAATMVLQMSVLGGPSARSRWAHVHLRHGLYANALFDRWLGVLRL